MMQLKFENNSTKAGFLPYIFENGQPVFMFMESSDAKFGGDKPMIAKGQIDFDESAKEAGIREAEEELGLKITNLKMNTMRKAWTGELSGLKATYVISIYMGEMRDKNAFNQPHYETKATHWLTLNQFRKIGRSNQLSIVEAATGLLLSGK